MANQTELLNVSDEMKLNENGQIIERQEHDEELCFSSSVSNEEEHNYTALNSSHKFCLSFSNFILLLTFNIPYD